MQKRNHKRLILIADKVTYESVDAGMDAVKEATDYICDKIKEVK